jgi:UDPglucose 6-dehydrogenase
MKYKLGVVGCGFVGTAVSTGFQTVLKDKVEIREYDKFKDTESLETVVEESDILFLCLPTPMNDDGSCNTSIIEEVVRDISMITFQRKLLVIKSTVPPGTTNKFQEKYPKLDFCFNPEFLTQANFINDFIKQDRIFLGWPEKPKFDMKNYLRIKNLYQDFNAKRLNDGTVVSILSSEGLAKDVEMAKYIANTFLTTKVVFFNEMYEICQAAGVDYEQAVSMATSDKRIGRSHTKVPGPDGQMGAGGPCFPKDTNALIAFAKEHGVDPMALESMWMKNLALREIHEWEDLAQVNGKYKKDE